jgi:hypothetical protein
MQPNEYDLSKKDVKDAPTRNRPTKVYSPEEIVAKLNGYVIVPKDNYMQIKPGMTHVRYIRMDGTFRCGGFVTYNPIESKDGRLLIKLRSGFSKRGGGNVDWLVRYEDIDRLYIKIGMEYKIYMETMDKYKKSQTDLLESIVLKLSERLKKINARLKRLEARDDTISVISDATYMTDLVGRVNADRGTFTYNVGQ